MHNRPNAQDKRGPGSRAGTQGCLRKIPCASYDLAPERRKVCRLAQYPGRTHLFIGQARTGVEEGLGVNRYLMKITVNPGSHPLAEV